MKFKILDFLKDIPKGHVMTYGGLALWTGFPGQARQVGYILQGLTEEEALEFPWHRVINAKGRISTYKLGMGNLQLALLESEGLVFHQGRCTLKSYLWNPKPLDTYLEETDCIK